MKKVIILWLLIAATFSGGVISPAEEKTNYSEIITVPQDTVLTTAEPAIDIEYTTIGTGKKMYSFAIFTDIQGDAGEQNLYAAVDAVIALNNDTMRDNDIQFVMVLGDLIHGVTKDFFETKDENGYRQEYYQVKTALERLELPPPAGAGIYYIPLVGNHDVWCLYDMYAHNDVFPNYPEELFAARDTDGEGGYFGSQFDQLSQYFSGWVSQPPPVLNPYPGDHPRTIYFQNFAFDFGGYHFICLDFCARDDFDPVGIGVPPGLKKFWGYADIHESVSNGTYSWLKSHLEYCQKKGISDVVIFSHHPLLYQVEALNDSVMFKFPFVPYFLPFAFRTDIKGELHVVADPSGWFKTATTLSNCRDGEGFVRWGNQKLHDGLEANRVEGDAAFGFNRGEYDCSDEYGALVALFSQYDIEIVHWFSGHYHMRGFNWIDPNIGAFLSVVPSITAAKDVYGINFAGEVRINDMEGAVITPGENPKGSFTIVTVLGGPSRLRTDPESDTDADGIVDEKDQCYNPDCNAVDGTGCPVDTDADGVSDCDDACPETAGTKNGCPEAGVAGGLVILGIVVVVMRSRV